MRRPRPTRAARAGFTLVELMVVMAILAVSALVSGLVMRSGGTRPAPADVYRQLADLRRRAVEQGTSISAVLTDSAGTHAVVALPDGSVVADATLHVDRRTGRRTNDAR
jgi:prepilin-type N-terminal cleavage/methylation domain-containing protein